MQTLAGQKIRRYRDANKLTRPALAAKIGVAWQTVQGWEDEGKRPRNPRHVQAIATLGIADAGDWFQPASRPSAPAEAA